jgi:uncharacterized integral membrane protein
MRLFIVLIVLLAVAAGLVFGALNADLVAYDVGFASVRLPKGAAVLAALLLGWILGGLVAWLGMSLRHRRVLRRARRSHGKTPARA